MSNRAPESDLWDALRGALATRALGIVSDLGIAQKLADGPRPVAELAEETGADPDTLHRLLRALASDGIFAEEEPGVFRNTDVSEQLLRRRLGRVRAPLRRRLAPGRRRAGRLRQGGVPTSSTAPTSGPGSPRIPTSARSSTARWSRARSSERSGSTGSTGAATRRSSTSAAATARCSSALLERQPGLRGIVFDLPETVRDEAALGDRIRFVEGSFFESVPEGDVYLLSTILHDWDDESAAAILRTIRAGAPPDARLILFEAVVPEGNEPDGGKWLDLLMLALFAGRERNEAQWRELLEAAGFEPTSIEDGLIQARCR